MKIRKRKLILKSIVKWRKSLLLVPFLANMIRICTSSAKWFIAISNLDSKYLQTHFATLISNLEKLYHSMILAEDWMDLQLKCRLRIKKVCLLTWQTVMDQIQYWWHLSSSVGYKRSLNLEILILMSCKLSKNKCPQTLKKTNKN